MYICEACGTDISIHALREEGDQAPCTSILFFYYFYPRPPRGGRLPKEPPKSLNCIISIHALREEGDINARKNCGCTACISIHALREEGDRIFSNLSPATVQFLSTPSARRATAKTETKSLFSNKLYNILHEFRRALIYNGSKNYPNHAKRLKNPVRRCRKNAENSPFAPGRETQNNSRPSCSKGG